MNHPVVHFEIGGKDTTRSKDFYSKLFGWKIEQSGAAQMVSAASDIGIGGHLSSLGHEPHNYVTIYVLADDIPAMIKKAESLGGSVVIPETEVPDMGHFAWIKDIDKNTIGLWKPMSQ